NFSTALARDGRNLPSPFTGLQTGAGFGEALSMGDFNGDAFRIRDLAVGIPSEDVNGVADVGVVGIFGGGLTGTGPVVLPTTGTAFTAQQLGGPSATRLRFGQTLVSGDFTGDNVDDLAVDAPDQSSIAGASSAGIIYLIPGIRNTTTVSSPSDSLININVNITTVFSG